MSSTLSADRRMERPASTETRLRELIALGFRFLHPTDGNGEHVAVVGLRVHHDVVDVVRLEAEDSVVAMRVPGDEENVLAPSRTCWEASGSVYEVLDELLRLPDDRETTARTGGGVWVAGPGGRAKWLAATG
ncbi:MAG TPA: hypothetical protein VGD67_21840 [Pseudonocardiaceae bacterium]